MKERYGSIHSPLDDGMFNAVLVADLDFWYHNYGDTGWYQVNEVCMLASRASIGMTYDYGWIDEDIVIGNVSYDRMHMDHIASATEERSITASRWVYLYQPSFE